MEEYIDKVQAMNIIASGKDGKAYFGTTDKDWEVMDFLKAVHPANVISIPEGATNGDMFLKTHPEVVATIIKKEGYLFSCVQLRNKEETIPFAEVYIDWWNAKYKKEVENE